MDLGLVAGESGEWSRLLPGSRKQYVATAAGQREMSAGYDSGRWLVRGTAEGEPSAVSTKRVPRSNSSFPGRLHHSAMQRR